MIAAAAADSRPRALPATPGNGSRCRPSGPESWMRVGVQLFAGTEYWEPGRRGLSEFGRTYEIESLGVSDGAHKKPHDKKST